jgi:PAS domain-containing protein
MEYLAGNGAQGTGDSVNQKNIASTTATDVFDLSSYDPLHQYVMQLTASSGLAPYAPGPDQYEVQQPQQQQQPQPPQQQQYYYIPQQQQQQGFTFPQPVAYPTVSQPGTFVNALSTQQPQQYIAAPLSPVAPLAPKPLLPAYATAPSGKRPRPTNEQATDKNQQMGDYSSFPSVVSASTITSNNAAFDNDNGLDKKLPANLASMIPEEKRRWERNVREQQRSHKISQQIKELRTVLTDSNVPFKPNKHSILQSVSDYIKQLQPRAIMLDVEHRKLIDTIRQTSEMVNSGQVPEPETSFAEKAEVCTNGEMLFVQGLDYKSIFDQSTAAMGIAALDGRILACNHEFVNALGYSREELLRLSLFSVMQNHEEVFRAMGEMLKAESIDGLVQDEDKRAMYWSGIVSQTEKRVSASVR